MFKVGDRVTSSDCRELKGQVMQISNISHNAHRFGIFWYGVSNDELNIYWNREIDLAPDFEYNDVLKGML